jgi:quercetin dioxygenase-like cupin family protein
MRRLLTGVASLAVVASAGCAADGPRASAPSTSAAHLEIRRAGTQPSRRGAEGNFTGSVTITPLFGATERTRASGGSVTFTPGARSVWHTHPAGQTLIITAGTGWVQEWGRPKQEIKAGDVVWTPPGVKHWHGATATESMTHVAVQEHVDGSVVRWMEPVTDEQYRSEERHP